MREKDAQSILEKLLERMTISYESITVGEGDIPGTRKFTIETKDSPLLIGKDGKNLLALTHIFKRVAENAYGNKGGDGGERSFPFYIDVGGYQSAKITSIQQVARTMADRAVSFKRDVELSPMSSYERMIVHSVIQELPALETESEGSGKFRHVVIKYKEEKVDF